jgi:TonB-linked SusC/RagA family outer membrane protein
MRKLYQGMWLTSAFALILTSSVLAQERNISGTVTDESGSSMPGVSVVIKGTTTGTATDAEGRYALAVPGDDAAIIFTFVGYAPTEVLVGSRSVVDVQMNPDIQTLTELVVTGYSVDNRRDVTGAVSTVKATDLTVVPSGNIEQQLQGRVAGVTVVTNGQPGTTSQVRVRGFGTFNDNAPLYVVDGLPVQSTDFLNPDDIESTTVLKDAATASIYGARAASGVIVYTTKKGTREGKPMQITFDSMFGFTTPGDGQSMMNPQDFADWTWNSVINTANANGDAPVFTHPQFGTGATPDLPDYLLVGDLYGVNGSVDLNAEREKYNVTNFSLPIYQVVRANLAGTNWYDEITRTAPIFRNTLGIRGSGENSRYYFGLSMQEQDGILLHQHFRRYAARINSEFDILKNLRFGENLQFTYRQVSLLLGGGGGAGVSDDENDILTAFRMPTIIPVYDEFGGYAGTKAAGFNNPRNPVANLDRQADNRGFEGSAFGNVYLEFEPITDLVLRTSLGGRYSSVYFWNYFARQYENSENNSAVTYGEGASYALAWTFTNTVNYKREFNEHSFDLLLGQEALNTGEGRGINGNGLNPFSEDRDFVTLSTTTPGSTRIVNSNYFKGVNFSSYFGRLNYIYNDKYLASVVVRRDGSSRFGSENRYGVFPAFSLGWRISSESFMSGVTWIDDLKIRGGYGVMGNSNNVPPDNQFSLYATNVGVSSYPIDNSSGLEGFYRSRIGNREGKWEKAITSNIGFDGTFFDGRVDVVMDVWQKDTEDLLFQVPITVGNGGNATAPVVNVGKMRNKGVDIQVVTRGNIKEAEYELTVNGGFLDNEIVELNPGATYLSTVDPSFRGITPIRNQLGYSISAFYGFQTLGLFQTQAEIDAAPLQDGVIRTQDADAENVAQGVGRFRFADINGDGEITQDDRTYLGSPVPKFTGGITFKVKYRAFDFETYMFASIGNKIWNQSKWFTDFYPSFAGAAISERVKGSWTTTNTGASIPIFENVSNFSTNTQANSFYVEDGSYFRLQNVTIGYNLPAATLSRLNMEKLRVFAGVNNLLTISGYEGLDPSVGGDADTRFGIDIGNYPITQSWTFGFNLGF